MRRPVRFFVHTVTPKQTLWLHSDEEGEESVVSVSSYDAMGHGRDCDRKLRVIVMQTGAAAGPQETT